MAWNISRLPLSDVFIFCFDVLKHHLCLRYAQREWLMAARYQVCLDTSKPFVNANHAPSMTSIFVCRWAFRVFEPRNCLPNGCEMSSHWLLIYVFCFCLWLFHSDNLTYVVRTLENPHTGWFLINTRPPPPLSTPHHQKPFFLYKLHTKCCWLHHNVVSYAHYWGLR